MPLRSGSLRRARPQLGTLVTIHATGDPRVLPAAFDHAFKAIDRIYRLMSFHEPDSDVTRLNRQAHRGPVRVDQQTWTVLDRAQCISEESNGAFDITIAPQLVRWGYLPESTPALPALKRNGYRAVELMSDHRVRFREPALIDVGGIAKGYAVDVACLELERFGVWDYVVNAGGDLRVGATATTIHVRHPRQPTATLALATVQGAAIATSATYFARKSCNDGSVNPIVVPATAAPARYRTSISVGAADCMTADALTKVVAILGSRATSALRRFDAEAFLLPKAGRWQQLPKSGQPSTAHAERSATLSPSLQ